MVAWVAGNWLCTVQLAHMALRPVGPGEKYQYHTMDLGRTPILGQGFGLRSRAAINGGPMNLTVNVYLFCEGFSSKACRRCGGTKFVLMLTRYAWKSFNLHSLFCGWIFRKFTESLCTCVTGDSRWARRTKLAYFSWIGTFFDRVQDQFYFVIQHRRYILTHWRVWEYGPTCLTVFAQHSW